MPPSEPTNEMPKKRKPASRRRYFALILVLALLASGVFAARHAGRWLVREDPLSKADAIVVLSGGLPFRAQAAADLFRLGYAPQVWVTQPDSPAPELRELGIHYLGEEHYSREVLIQKGVPISAIQILPETIVNTEQEVDEITRELRRTGKTTVIIVTSPQHTRRVRALWKKIARGGGQTLIVRAAAEDPFDANHWWRNTRDAFAVVREYMGLANVWAGLPVRPHSP
jgi:uncharacterized SAM-binding protein YcdF (DUF218 family)